MMKLACARFPLFMLIQTECSHVVRTQMNEYFSFFFSNLSNKSSVVVYKGLMTMKTTTQFLLLL